MKHEQSRGYIERSADDAKSRDRMRAVPVGRDLYTVGAPSTCCRTVKMLATRRCRRPITSRRTTTQGTWSHDMPRAAHERASSTTEDDNIDGLSRAPQEGG